MDAKVIFKYQKDQDDELNLEVGDHLVDVVMVDDGWCEGTLKSTGVRGMFPDNFVEMIEPSQPKPPPPAAVIRTPQVPEIHIPKRDTQVPQHRRAEVTYSFAATNDDELSLEPGDVVQILEEEEEGWWRGLLNGKEGVFPSNFVTAIKEVEEPTPPPQTAKSHERTRPPSMVAMHGLGGVNPLEIRNKLKPVSSSNKAPVPVHPFESKGPSIAERPRASTGSRMTRTVPKAKVMFGFNATEEDELTVVEGDIVEVVDKVTDQDGWWMIRKEGGQEGLVPDNFLEVIEKALPPEPKPVENPPLPPKKVEAPKPNVPIPGARAVLPKLPDKNEFPPEKPDPFLEPPATVADELEVPHNGLLDNNKVKHRPKKNPARPPSKSNLQTPDEEVDSKRPESPPAEDKGDEVSGGGAPWQQEARNRKNKSAVPPPVTTPTKANAPGTRPKPTKTSKPPPQMTPKPVVPPTHGAPPTQTVPPGKSVSTGILSGGVSTLSRPAEPPTTTRPLDTEESSGQWKKAFESLQEEVAKFKKEIKEDMRILAQDLDEERKKNASLKIDVQRLMKTAGFREREIVIS